MKIIKEPFMQLQPEHFISVTFETEVKEIGRASCRERV